MNFHFRISRFFREPIEKTRTRKAICMRSVKAPARVRSTGHVENFKTTISPVKECYLSSNLHIHFPVTPKKPTVSPFTFFGSRNRPRPFIMAAGKGAETRCSLPHEQPRSSLFIVRVLPSFPRPPRSSFPRNGLSASKRYYIYPYRALKTFNE